MPEQVALYLRVSTGEQDLRGQQRALERLAAERGWLVARVYAEKISASGGSERSEHAQLLVDAAAASRPFQHVLVWSLDRWSRETSFVKALGSIERLEQAGVQFHCLQTPELDSRADARDILGRDVTRGVLAAIASFEARQRSARTQVAMDEIRSGRRRTKTGRPVGRPRRLTPELEQRIRELRWPADGSEGLPWAQVAQTVHLPGGTCRKVQRAPRPEIPRAENGPGGFGAHGGRVTDHPAAA